MSFEIQQQKNALRQEILSRRRALSPEEKNAKSAQIRGKVLALSDYQGVETIFCYVSLPDEVDTHALLQDALAAGKTVYAPTRSAASRLAWGRVVAWESLQPGLHGILEPSETNVAPPDTTSALVIVPGVAFTRRGDRLGRGGGDFDRLLTNVAHPTIGLAFECQLVDELPLETHDVSVETIVTESTVYAAQGSR